MKERPILFSGAMIRAILAGQKTQTRRVIKPSQTPCMSIEENDAGKPWPWREDCNNGGDIWYPCPYGQPGDRLWVREAWSTHACFDHLRPSECPKSIHYWADGEIKTGKRRPSIHMPRWASRILLEIVSVRVERLQSISEADAEAEGIDFLRHVNDADETLTARDLYECLWDSVNGEGSWAANPWVWVVEFKRVEGQPL